MISLLLLSLSSSPQAGSADVALFLGPPGGAGDVVVVDEAGLAPPQPVAGLSSVRLLDLDASGRSAWTALLPDQPRRRTDVAGAARILLPADRGSIYRFRRDTAGGGAFGFFRVDADGAVTVLHERPGHGPGADLDPFLERVGVDPAASGLLVATVPAAGGDLIELDLDGGTATNRTAALAPLTFTAPGGRLLPTWGVAVAQEGVVRFDRAPGAQGELVAVPGIAAPTWWDGGVVVSADGSMAATVAGAAPTVAHVLCLGATGAAHPLDPAPQHLSGAGFDAAAGPYLALSTDGSTAAWRTHVVKDREPSREAWIGATAVATAAQVTADGKFVDTLDETGLIGFVGATKMILGVGELADPDIPGSTDIDGMDLYLTELHPDGTTTIQNLSLTSGIATQPFGEGELRTEEGVYRMPNGDALVRIRDLDLVGRVQAGASGVQPLVSQVDELLAVEHAGDRVLFRTLQTGGAQPQRLYAYDPASGQATLLGAVPAASQVTRFATRTDGRIAFVLGLFGSEWLVRADLVALAVELATPTPLSLGPALGFTGSASLALTIGAPGAPAVPLAWFPGGGGALLPVAPTPAQVLPGGS
jgi:hypothetical protein